MDPTDQATIDKKMVQEIDGTENEWGWCKKKVRAQTTCLCRGACHSFLN